MFRKTPFYKTTWFFLLFGIFNVETKLSHVTPVSDTFTLVFGANAMISLKNIAPPDIGCGQGHEIILQDIANKPSQNTGHAISREKSSDPMFALTDVPIVVCRLLWLST